MSCQFCGRSENTEAGLLNTRLMLSSSFRCDQIHNCHIYEFGHSLLCQLIRTQLFNKPTPGNENGHFYSNKKDSFKWLLHPFKAVGGTVTLLVVFFQLNFAKAKTTLISSKKLFSLSKICIGDSFLQNVIRRLSIGRTHLHIPGTVFTNRPNKLVTVP